jgi:hypothetical protein
LGNQSDVDPALCEEVPKWRHLHRWPIAGVNGCTGLGVRSAVAELLGCAVIFRQAKTPAGNRAASPIWTDFAGRRIRRASRYGNAEQIPSFELRPARTVDHQKADYRQSIV